MKVHIKHIITHKIDKKMIDEILWLVKKVYPNPSTIEEVMNQPFDILTMISAQLKIQKEGIT
jgi:hypothetical protein